MHKRMRSLVLLFVASGNILAGDAKVDRPYLQKAKTAASKVFTVAKEHPLITAWTVAVSLYVVALITEQIQQNRHWRQVEEDNARRDQRQLDEDNARQWERQQAAGVVQPAPAQAPDNQQNQSRDVQLSSKQQQTINLARRYSEVVLPQPEATSAASEKARQRVNEKNLAIAAIEYIAGIKEQPQASSSSAEKCPICLSNPNCLTMTCKHAVCRSCGLKALQLAIKEKNQSLFRCPTEGCTGKYTNQDFHSLFPAQEQQAHLGIIRAAFDHCTPERKLGTNEKECPTPDCRHIFTIEPNGPAGEVTCPECTGTLCAQCFLNHGQRASCEEAQQMRKAKNTIDEATTNRRNGVRKCPNCKKSIQRTEGCNHMTCLQSSGGCGHQFCWLCDRTWGAYDDHGCPTYHGVQKSTATNPIF